MLHCKQHFKNLLPYPHSARSLRMSARERDCLGSNPDFTYNELDDLWWMTQIFWASIVSVIMTEWYISPWCPNIKLGNDVHVLKTESKNCGIEKMFYALSPFKKILSAMTNIILDPYSIKNIKNGSRAKVGSDRHVGAIWGLRGSPVFFPESFFDSIHLILPITVLQ